MKIRDDIAYILPMGIFLGITALGGFWEGGYPWIYVAKAILTAVALIVLWPAFTRIRWNHWWLGVIVGVVGIFQWVGMQLWLQKVLPNWFAPAENPFNPFATFESPVLLYGWICIRILSAAVVVPIMEELFWRDFGWRTILAPNDFKLAGIGEWGWPPFLIIAGMFATVHGNWWATSVVWAMMIGGLLVYTKSIGACIIAHGVTNLLLAVYVLVYRDWAFW